MKPLLGIAGRVYSLVALQERTGRLLLAANATER
jgi:hypothetical protein